MVSPVTIPKGYVPKSLNIKASWPEIFKMTIEDWSKLISLCVQASNANIIARKTATRKVAKFFDIVDIDAEHEEIAAQPVFNPFGSFQ